MGMPAIPEGFDFTDPDLYAQRLPHEEYAALRRTAPVWWNVKTPGSGGFDDDGYWVVTKHRDVKEVSRDTETYSAAENTAIPRFFDGMTREAIEVQRNIMLNMDPPKHSQVRKIVTRAFTVKAMQSLRPDLERRARAIVRQARESGRGDFVTKIASELPLQAIAGLIGIPQEDREKVFNWSNQMTGYDDPEYDVDPTTASAEILGYAYNLAEERQKCPADDIITTLLNAELDGGALSSEEFGWFVILLAVAGNETTRNAISHGMVAFLDHPEQWELFKRERPATAADEIVRWATPVTVFQRTATRDTELGGQRIRQGDRVALFYASANFDEDVFDRPFEFDITRDPNPHLGFGGTGEHYCLGANLARMEIDLIFNAVADELPDMSRLGDPRRLRSGWLNGLKEFPVDFTGTCPVAR